MWVSTRLIKTISNYLFFSSLIKVRKLKNFVTPLYSKKKNKDKNRIHPIESHQLQKKGIDHVIKFDLPQKLSRTNLFFVSAFRISKLVLKLERTWSIPRKVYIGNTLSFLAYLKCSLFIENKIILYSLYLLIRSIATF